MDRLAQGDASIRLATDVGGTFTDVVLDTGETYFTSKIATTIDTAYESRYDQYDLALQKPEPLVPRYLRYIVFERVDVRGRILRPLDTASVSQLVTELQQNEIESVAIGLLHSYANPEHEKVVADMLRAAGVEAEISLSSEVCPEVREYEHFMTTVCNAYVQPLMARYLRALQDALVTQGITCPLLLMTSGGGITTLDAAIRFPIRLVESGPNGGAVLASGIARRLLESKVLSYDMGGTTAKICLIDDYQPQNARNFEIARSCYMTTQRFDAETANRLLADLYAEAFEVVCKDAGQSNVEVKRSAYMRYVGQGHEIEVPLPEGKLSAEDSASIQSSYEFHYQRLFGRTIPQRDIEFLSWSVEVSGPGQIDEATSVALEMQPARAAAQRSAYCPELKAMIDYPVYEPDKLVPGNCLSGPALVLEAQTTTYIPNVYNMYIDNRMNLVIDRRST